MSIDRFGVHIWRSQPYLFQENRSQGINILFPEGEKSRDAVITKAKCPHQLELGKPQTQVDLPKGFLDNPIVDFFLPKPQLEIGQLPEIKIIRNDSLSVFPTLRKLSYIGGANDHAVQMWTPNLSNVQRLLTASNLVPLALTCVKLEHSQHVSNAVDFALTQSRKLLLCVGEHFPISSSFEDLTEPLAAIVPELVHIRSQELLAVANILFPKIIAKQMDQIYGYSSKSNSNS